MGKLLLLLLLLLLVHRVSLLLILVGIIGRTIHLLLVHRVPLLLLLPFLTQLVLHLLELQLLDREALLIITHRRQFPPSTPITGCSCPRLSPPAARALTPLQVTPPFVSVHLAPIQTRTLLPGRTDAPADTTDPAPIGDLLGVLGLPRLGGMRHEIGGGSVRRGVIRGTTSSSSRGRGVPRVLLPLSGGGGRTRLRGMAVHSTRLPVRRGGDYACCGWRWAATAVIGCCGGH
mmetsp:Transcript_19225/g.34735  ORF Transcript_19225/g.34735 Transcript_19225/m.34735 type:complete len:232 (+) Transcript_19225:1009-1704(+)